MTNFGEDSIRLKDEEIESLKKKIEELEKDNNLLEKVVMTYKWLLQLVKPRLDEDAETN